MAAVIVGGGLSGACLGAMLAQDGRKVRIYEARPDLRRDDTYEGRSINLALSARGLTALRHVGVEQEVLDICVPMYNRALHDVQGNITLQPYGQPGQCNYSVPRKALNEILLDAAERAGATVFFEKRLVDLNVRDPKTPLTFADSKGDKETISCDCVFGADGVFSVTRGRLQRTARFNLAQTYITHGYKELCIPPGPGGTFRLNGNALHIWPRDDFMLIALPNADGSFTVTLFLPFGEDGVFGFRDLDSDEKVLSFFKTNFPDVVPLLPTLIEDFNRNPLGQLMYVRCEPWSFGDRVCLVSDAASGVVPFHGQGINSGMQHCTEFMRILRDECAGDIHAAIPAFAKFMKPHGDAISELAVENYIHMRQYTNSTAYKLRWKLELFLNKLFPNSFIPRYMMITFHDEIMYADAVKKAKKQELILDAALATVGALTLGAVIHTGLKIFGKK